MPEETSSLRTAIGKIMDWPAGGAGGVAPRSDVANLGTTATLENVVPEAAPDPFAAELAGLQASNAALSTQLAAPAAAPAAASASLMPDYKSYHEYYADNPEALSKAGYLSTAGQPLSTTTGVGGDWTNENPYRFRNEYNEYLSTMPTEYQALGKSNITGESVKAGVITGVYDPVTKQTYSVGPNVAPGTVKAGTAVTPTALTKPVNPGSRAPWQQSQQYWKDLDAYTKAGGK